MKLCHITTYSLLQRLSDIISHRKFSHAASFHAGPGYGLVLIWKEVASNNLGGTVSSSITYGNTIKWRTGGSKGSCQCRDSQTASSLLFTLCNYCSVSLQTHCSMGRAESSSDRRNIKKYMPCMQINVKLAESSKEKPEVKLTKFWRSFNFINSYAAASSNF